MKVHFIGALEGNQDDYRKIIDIIESKDHNVLTKHSIERKISQVESETSEEAELYAKRMNKWIRSADVVVVEVTTPGLGTGFEVATALDVGRPVIAIYKPKKDNIPHVLRAMEGDDKIQVLSYNDNTLAEVLSMALDYASDTMDTRFNFFISPKHQHYLDWVSKNRMVPRAVFLRRLIEREMEKDEEYNS